MISTEIQPSDASPFHIQPSTAQQLLEDVHIEASSTQNPPSNSNTLSDSNADNQEPLSTFTLFPLLPTELRLRIWRLATFTRVVSFVPGGGKAPRVLSACRESRTATRKLYRLCICPSSPILRDPDPPCKIIPEHGFFINYEVDILHVSPLFGFQKMRESNHAGIGILLGHNKSLMILNSRFPLWHLPTKRILFELPGPQAPADWSHRHSYYSSPTAMAWGSLFGRTAILCPLLEEIMFLRSDELESNQPARMVSATNASNAAFVAAVNAFTEAEKISRKENNFFSGIRTEKEASQRIMETPKAPEGSNGRFGKFGWWDNNPKLTFVEVEEQ